MRWLDCGKINNRSWSWFLARTSPYHVPTSATLQSVLCCLPDSVLVSQLHIGYHSTHRASIHIPMATWRMPSMCVDSAQFTGWSELKTDFNWTSKCCHALTVLTIYMWGSLKWLSLIALKQDFDQIQQFKHTMTWHKKGKLWSIFQFMYDLSSTPLGWGGGKEIGRELGPKACNWGFESRWEQFFRYHFF